MADGHFPPSTNRLVSASEEALPVGTYGLGFSVDRRSDGQWAVSQNVHAIDRDGEKDTFTDILSLWPTEAAALAELARVAPGHIAPARETLVMPQPRRAYP